MDQQEKKKVGKKKKPRLHNFTFW